MNTTHSLLIKKAIPLLLGISLVFQSTLAAKPILDDKVPEYLLKGTTEQASEYNFNIAPGGTVTDYLTIVNNTDQPISYNLEGVDSQINNQQMIVFNANKLQSPNLGQWITFEKNTVTVEAKSSLQIPFTVSVPSDAFPGSYNGGISIQKIVTDSFDTTDKNFVVKVQTRQVLSLITHVSGETKSTFVLGELNYDANKKTYSFSIENTGNTILSFEGQLTISGNDFLEQVEKEIKVEKFRILPNTTVNQKVLYLTPPLFGNHQVVLNGELMYFDGVKNADQPLDTVQLSLTHSFADWNIIYWTLGVILLLLLLLVVLILREKSYLKQCTEYLVKTDDTLITIAQEHQMSWKKLARINKISAPYSIKPGQKILVHEKQKK